MIEVGQNIPAVTLKRLGVGGIEDVDFADYIRGRKVIIFGVPGAFTPSCHGKHLPGYVENAESLKKVGVDEIVCLAVNDPFVMKAWGEAAGADGKVTMMPDGNGQLTKALGLEFDGSGAGLGVRSKRYSMLVEDGVVQTLRVEEIPSDVDLSSALVCMDDLKSVV